MSATTYRITYLAGLLDTSVCPPAIVAALFPAFDGWPVTLSESECIVTAPSPQTPADLGPLVKVELVTKD
jgi:hypothetical protein